MRLDFPEVIDSTMRAARAACRRKVFWNYHYEIVPDGENVHLHAGAAFAKGMEVARRSFFGEGKSEEEAVLDGAQALLKFWGSFDPGEDHAKQPDRVLGAYEYQMSIHRMSQDSFRPVMTPLGPYVEFNFALPIPDTRHPTTGNPILYAGRFDMLAIKDNTFWIVDEKTATQLGDSWVRQWLIRAQFTGYAWGAGQLGYPITAAEIRGTSILKTTYGHADSIIFRKPWQIDRWLVNLQREISEWIEDWKEWRILTDHNQQDPIGEPALVPWVQALDQACSAYGACPYLKLCDMPDPKPYIPIYYKEHHWDPIQHRDT